MNVNLQHYYAIEKLVTNSLTALYLEIAIKNDFWSVKKRNEFLVKFLKQKGKLAQFVLCKKDIKVMIAVGRKANSNLERKLWEVNQINLDYKAKLAHADELYILLTDLFEQYQFASFLDDMTGEKEQDVIYMCKKNIEKGFDENNKQIQPLRMTVKTARLKELIDVVQTKGTYRVEVVRVDECGLIHILLHRVEDAHQTSRR